MSEAVDAVTLAALYRRRWRLETAFQHLEAHPESEINTLTYARAALLGFCLALVAYDVFSLALSALDGVHQEPVSETISTYYIGHEIAKTFLSLLLLTTAKDWRFLVKYSVAEFAGRLRDIAMAVNLKKYKKHSHGPKKPKPKTPYDPKQPHVSTQQLLTKQKKKRGRKEKKAPQKGWGLTGQLFGDKGYISQPLFNQLWQQGWQLVTRIKKNMKNKLMPLRDKILLRKRGIIESVHNILKSQCHIEHSRHRSHINFMAHLVAD